MDEYFFRQQVSAVWMDALWAEGWRHFGAYFYRYSQVPHAGRLCTVMPLRLPLAAFKASSSQARVLKRNADLELRFVPAFVNTEVEALFERHKLRFKDNIPPSIYTFVSKCPASVPCDCLSVCLYEKDALIAISYLDIGKTACSSIYQCFDPAFSRRSLGVLMMLLAIQYGLEHGKTYYYPGYAYLEASHYDYKKRLLGLEYFDWQGHWLPLAKISSAAQK